MPGAVKDIESSLLSVRDRIGAALGETGSDIFNFSSFPALMLGKGVRARFALLCGRALGADPARIEQVAAAAELAHTASLLHDDCIDEARRRRGKPTVNEALGVNAAILAGDLVVAMAFELAASAEPSLGRELVKAVRHMTEGALLEENSRGRLIDAAAAARIADLKTAALFRWCSLSACSLAGKPALLEACARLGSGTGALFQLVDDVLDFEGDPEKCGKEVLKDAAEGKLTLPLILALNSPAHGARAAALREKLAAGPGDLAAAADLAALVRDGGFAAEARAEAARKVEALLPDLAVLPDREGAAGLKAFLLAMAERRN